MKKLIVLITVFSLGLSAFASPKDFKGYRSEKFSYGLAFSKIVVEDNIDLVLYENATTNIQFDGNQKDIASIEWKVKKGVLYISSKNGPLKNKVIVTIDVAALSDITLEGQSSVRSLGNLNSPELNVFMKGGCFAAIRNTGAINVINTDDTDMNVIEMTGNVDVR
ncbi:MAG: DUF2807 domain-containing protein [Ferruginibacter sp.]